MEFSLLLLNKAKRSNKQRRTKSNSNIKMRKKAILPAQIRPFPVNPGLHMHSKYPALSIHVAFSWQL